MKTKTSSFGKAFLSKKRFALVKIAIVLCSLFLVATLPIIAADQPTQTVTTASEDDFVLGIYGNANEDDTIDMRDLTYVKLIFFGKKPEMELADAKYDGEINPLDFIQIKLIIVGKERELTIVDKIPSKSSLSGKIKERSVTVRKPVNRVIVTWADIPQVLRALNAADKIVGIDNYVKGQNVLSLFPEISKLPSIGSQYNPDLEAVLNLNPDVVIPGTGGYWKEAWLEKTPGVTVIYLPLRDTADDYVQGMRKLGYIFDKEEEVEELLQWREDWLNKIKERTEELSEDEKPRVLSLSHFRPGGPYMVWPKDSLYTVMCGMAGGKSILPEHFQGISVVDPEWVVEQNPDIIFAHTIGIKKRGYMDDPSEMAACREDLMTRSELANTTAVKNGAVYNYPSIITMDETGFLIGCAYMAKYFHPELLENFDPREVHQEQLTRFQHIDYNVYEHGVFVYPPLKD